MLIRHCTSSVLQVSAHFVLLMSNIVFNKNTPESSVLKQSWSMFGGTGLLGLVPCTVVAAAGQKKRWREGIMWKTMFKPWSLTAAGVLFLNETWFYLFGF